MAVLLGRVASMKLIPSVGSIENTQCGAQRRVLAAPCSAAATHARRNLNIMLSLVVLVAAVVVSQTCRQLDHLWEAFLGTAWAPFFVVWSLMAIFNAVGALVKLLGMIALAGVLLILGSYALHARYKVCVCCVTLLAISMFINHSLPRARSVTHSEKGEHKQANNTELVNMWAAVPAVVVINCPHRTDRLGKFRDVAKIVGIPESLITVHQPNCSSSEPGNVKVTATRLDVMESLLEQGVDWAMVFEDDVDFLQGWEPAFRDAVQLMSVASRMRNSSFDYLMLGGAPLLLQGPVAGESRLHYGNHAFLEASMITRQGMESAVARRAEWLVQSRVDSTLHIDKLLALYLRPVVTEPPVTTQEINLAWNSDNPEWPLITTYCRNLVMLSGLDWFCASRVLSVSFNLMTSTLPAPFVHDMSLWLLR